MDFLVFILIDPGWQVAMSRKALKVFITVETVLYASFVILDIISVLPAARSIPVVSGTVISVPYLKYVSVILCACVAVITTAKRLSRGRITDNTVLPAVLITTGLIFTVFSDYFLLFRDDFLPGIISFCAVQTVYLVLITAEGARFWQSGSPGFVTDYHVPLKTDMDISPSSKNRIFNGTIRGVCRRSAVILAVRLMICGSAFIIAGQTGADSIMTAFVLFYGISFLGNILHQIVNVSKEMKSGLIPAAQKEDVTWQDKFTEKAAFSNRGFLIGLILFVLCDINVLIYNIGNFLEIAGSGYQTVREISVVLIWLFYLPSQVMIVLSVKEDYCS